MSFARTQRARTTCAPRSPFASTLDALARVLAQRGVRWAVLRGGEEFPALAPGSDLDILVRASDARAFEAALSEACASSEAWSHERHRTGPFLQYHLAREMPDGGRAFLTLDVHRSEACYGVPYLEAGELPINEPKSGGLPRLALGAEAVVNFLPSLLSGGRVAPEYAERIADALARDERTTRRWLARVLGERRACSVVDDLARGRHGALERDARRTRFTVLARAFTARPLHSALALVRFGFAVRVVPLFRPRGLFVVFLGTDGSGKSTLMEAVRKELAPVFRSATSKTYHLRPGLIPQLDRIVHLGRATYGPEDCAEPHRAEPSGRLLSNARATYYAIDYLLGYLLRVLPRRRRHSLILFDRYFYDYLVDPQRCRVRPGTLAASIWARIVPRPDAVVVCTAPADVVQTRKRELTPVETARQLEAYEDLARRAGYHVVSTDQPLSEARREVVARLFPPNLPAGWPAAPGPGETAP